MINWAKNISRGSGAISFQKARNPKLQELALLKLQTIRKIILFDSTVNAKNQAIL